MSLMNLIHLKILSQKQDDTNSSISSTTDIINIIDYLVLPVLMIQLLPSV